MQAAIEIHKKIQIRHSENGKEFHHKKKKQGIKCTSADAACGRSNPGQSSVCLEHISGKPKISHAHIFKVVVVRHITLGKNNCKESQDYANNQAEKQGMVLDEFVHILAGNLSGKQN
jgi:hypothetical protein